MARVLTVDDSKAVRMIVVRQLQGMGHEVDEAEDGANGLAKLASAHYDLVVLDVTMPVLDGPAMLARMREAGDRTPVLMLTSESKRSIIAGLMKAGIADYILKPFKPEELKSKVLKALRTEGGGALEVAVRPPGAVQTAPGAGAVSPFLTSAAPPAAGAALATGAEMARDAVDILVIDDMENVAKRLRQLLPEHLSMNHALSGPAAVAMCRERVYRAILVDSTMPDVNSASLVRQLRLLQGGASFAGMCLRSSPRGAEESSDLGCDFPLLKPFDAAGLEEFVARLSSTEPLVAVEDNVLTLAPFKGKAVGARVDGYFAQASRMLLASAEDIATACFPEVILDLSGAPSIPEKMVRLLIDLQDRISRMGLVLRVVAPAGVAEGARSCAEIATLEVFSTVADARRAA